MKIEFIDYYKNKNITNFRLFSVKLTRYIIIKTTMLKRDGDNAYYINNNLKDDLYLLNSLNRKVFNIKINNYNDNENSFMKYFESENNIIKKLSREKYNIEKKKKSTMIRNSGLLYWNLYWYNLHWLSINYPLNPSPEQINQVNKLVEIMQTPNGISCSKCRNHFKLWVKNNPISEHNNDKISLFKYFVDCHNDVNKRNKKKVWSLDEAFDTYVLKKWETELEKYGFNVLNLFKDNKLVEFPKLLNTVGRKKIKEIGTIFSKSK